MIKRSRPTTLKIKWNLVELIPHLKCNIFAYISKKNKKDIDICKWTNGLLRYINAWASPNSCTIVSLGSLNVYEIANICTLGLFTCSILVSQRLDTLVVRNVSTFPCWTRSALRPLVSKQNTTKFNRKILRDCPRWDRYIQHGRTTPKLAKTTTKLMLPFSPQIL